MKKIFFLILMFSVSFCFGNELRSIVEIKSAPGKSHREMVEILNEEGLDILQINKNSVVAVVSASQKLFLADYRTTVLMENADDVFKEFKAKGSEGNYHSYQETMDLLNSWVKKYPNLCSLEEIGKSHEKRSIMVLKISDNPKIDEMDEEELLIAGLHHAREWMSVEVPLHFAGYLLNNYATNPECKKLVDNREFFIIPIVNPDGLEYSQKNYKFWRKNRRDNGDGKYGVDLNRNYGYQWGTVGASTYPGSDTYHGPVAFSEPETSAVRDFVNKHQILASICFHSYSELILYPFAYGYDAVNPDEQVFIELGKKMAKFNNYKVQNCTELYACMGISDDWFYGEKGILAFTYELDKSFIPSESQIPVTCEMNLKALLCFANEVEGLVPGHPTTKIKTEKKIQSQINQ